MPTTSSRLFKPFRIGAFENIASPIIIAFSLALAMIAGCASMVPLDSARNPTWRIVPDSDPASIVAQTNSQHAVVSVLCMPDGCRLLIVSSSPCEENATIPILISTPVEAGIATASCLPTEHYEPGRGDTGAVYLHEPNMLLPQIILGDKTIIAVPASDGQIMVYPIPMAGLRALMESKKPDVFKFSREPADNPFNPYDLPPPPNLNQNEIERWHRNLESI